MHGRVTGFMSSVLLGAGMQICPKRQLLLGTWMRRSIAEDEGKLHPRVWGPAWGGFAGSPGCAGAGFCTGVTGWDWFLQEIPPSRKGKLPCQGLCMSCSCGIMELAWGDPAVQGGALEPPALEQNCLCFISFTHHMQCLVCATCIWDSLSPRSCLKKPNLQPNKAFISHYGFWVGASFLC